MQNLLSICIATYNREKEVEECVRNCLEVVDKYTEVIVCDNCSTDNTKERLERIVDSRFKYYRNEKNIGYSNILKVLMYATSRYALILNEKDNLDTDGLKELISVLKKQEIIAVVYGNYRGGEGRTGCRYGEGGVYKYSDIFDNKYMHWWWGGYSSGIVYNTKLLHKVEAEIDKSTYLWKLYPFRYAEILMYPYGDIVNLGCDLVCFQRKCIADVHAWSAGGDVRDVYWTVYSGYAQIKEWVDVFARVYDEHTLIKLMRYFGGKAFKHAVTSYYSLMTKDFCVEKMPALKELYAFDLNKSRRVWRVWVRENYKQLWSDMIRKWYVNKLPFAIRHPIVTTWAIAYYIVVQKFIQQHFER